MNADDQPKRRSRRRRNVIGSSAHQQDYDNRLGSGQSSLWLERYAKFVHGEDIPASTFRERRKKLGIETPKTFHSGQPDDDPVDVMHMLELAVKTQAERIGIDHAHERTMNKLLATGRFEVDTLVRACVALREAYQALGLFPVAPQEFKVETQNGLSFSEWLGGADRSEPRRMSPAGWDAEFNGGTN